MFGGAKNLDLTYISIKEANTNIELARFGNELFNDLGINRVNNGSNLLNMVQYKADLSKHIGKNVYIEVVDNSTSDWGLFAIDSVRTYYEKSSDVPSSAVMAYNLLDKEGYQVENGNFETGDLTGWEVNGAIGVVSDASGWWNEELPYNKNGQFVFTGVDNENAIGSLTSSSFEISGSGYITFLLGGGKNPKLCYVSIFEKDTNVELARYANSSFNDLGIETINKGSNLLNMITYKADLSKHIGKEVYIKITDNATSDWGLIAVDNFVTFYHSEASIPSLAVLAHNMLEDNKIDGSTYQVENGNFEKGDLTGWVSSGDEILGVSSSSVWWNENFSFEKEGTYFLNGWNTLEENKGTLTSSSFEVSGSGFITFKLGGGKNSELCNIEIIDSDTEEVLARFGNSEFRDLLQSFTYSQVPIVLSERGYYLANMVEYKADLSSLIGRNVKIRIVDNAENDWGLLFVDDFITYYEHESDINENAKLAVNLLVKE